MNFSLKKRIAASFIGANLMILIIGVTVFYYLDSLNKQIEIITNDTNQINLLTDEVRISAVSILKSQKRLSGKVLSEDDVERVTSLVESFQAQLQRLSSFYEEVEVKTIISKMLGYVDSLNTLLGKITFDKRADAATLGSAGEIANKILDVFSEFQDIQYYQSEQRDKQIKEVIVETRQYMLIVLIITFLFTILLGLVIPGKIALPFKKITDAVRELQDCNFDVSIYYNQNDEIGELALEINKMIASMKYFEELRTDRISVEHRKFDILANLIKKNVLIANADGELIYLNNQMYNLLNIESNSVLNKNIEDTVIPSSIKEAYNLALKRRSKIDNAEVLITQKVLMQESDEDGQPLEVESDETIFAGFANVIPIRAKESSLDYYIMVLSEEMFS